MARPIRKREQIERGVVEVVARNGLRGTTIQDIASAAGVSPGLLYRYWKDRDHLAAEVYRKHYFALLDQLVKVAAGQKDALAKLRSLVRAFLDFADREPVLLRFLLLSQHDLAAGLPDSPGVRGLARQILEEGMAAGRFRRGNVDLGLQILLGIVLQPAVGVAYGHLRTPVSGYFDEIYAAVERVFVAERSGDGS